MKIVDIIKNIIINKDYKVIIENFVSLSGLTAASYILPLITFPYLTRVLGPEKFGLIAFATAFVTYFIFFTDYGFHLSATKEVAINRKNKEKISEIFSAVMLIKFMLVILSLIIFTVIIFSFNQFKDEWLVFYLSFGTVIGYVLFPIWFFQGMENMKYITILNIISRLIFTVAIFIFIRDVSDYILVPFINSMGYIIAGLLGFYISINKFNLKLKLPSINTIKYQLNEGWHVFISQMSVGIYRATNTFILGIFTNNVVVGYYSVAEQIIVAVVGLLTPISQSIYPYISRTVAKSQEDGIKFIRKILLIMGGFGGFLSLFILIFAGTIINILAGDQYEQSILVLQILAFLPLIIALGTVFGVQTMLTFNYKKAFSHIIVSAGVLNVVLALILAPSFEQIGVAISFLITEIFVTINTFLYLHKKGIRLIKPKSALLRYFS